MDISSLPTEAKLRGELTLSAWSYPYLLYAFSVGYSFGPDLRELHLIGSASGLFRAYGFEIVTVSALFGALLVSGLMRSAGRGRALYLLTIAVVPLALVTAVAMINIKVFNVRYLTCILPVFVVLVSAGLPRGRIGRIGVGIAVCAVMLMHFFVWHPKLKSALYTLGITTLLAIGLELLQALLPVRFSRACDPHDLVPSIAGAACGIVVTILVRLRSMDRLPKQ